jgi:hypothetical protein
MFEAVGSLGGLDIQLAFFRGTPPRAECKASHWVSTPADRIMRGVSCVPGETQIGRVLSHAIREAGQAKVGALILIGDAIEEPIDTLCQRAGELRTRGTPIFAFFEASGYSTHQNALAGFQQIAAASGGACLPFDLASADRLKELLGAVAVFVAGGRPALEAHAKKIGGPVLMLTHQLAR